MRYKFLGGTEVRIPVIGQGTGLGNYSSQNKSYRDLRDTIRAGIEAGMTFLDTAPVYGEGASEEVVGEAIAGIRSEVFLATKVPPEQASRAGISLSVNESLRRLKTDCIDLYQVHWPNPKIPMAETMGAMAELVRLGKIRHIGVSNFSLNEVKEAQAVLPDGKIVSVQAEYNLFDRTTEERLQPYCEAQKLTCIAYSPLHRGKITSGAGRRQILQEIARRYKRTPAQIALRWLTQHAPVVAIPNTSNIERAKENAQGADFDLAAEDIELIDRTCSVKPALVPTRKIRVSSEYGRQTYHTVEEAKQNKLNFVPSPMELAEKIREGEFLKPVRLVPLKAPSSGYEYDLAEGRIRYWAWVIAHEPKDKPIWALIDE